MTEKRLTKEEAQALYDDLSKAISQKMAKAPNTYTRAAGSSAKSVAAPSAPQAPSTPSVPSSPAAVAPQAAARPIARANVRGPLGALALVTFFCVAKIAVSALEVAGIGQVEPVQATVVAPAPTGPQWSKEEVKILTALDYRRAELEERASRLEQREHEFVARDRDLAVRLTELKEISERLKLEREKGDKQRDVQLEQLANVYGSMNPPEAAHLLEQLDINIAHSLVKRMPEKRIGQILALMNPQRALDLTNRLSSKLAK